MKATYFKRTICAALAGLMLALTACGNTDLKGQGNNNVSVVDPPTGSGDTSSSNTNAEDVPSPAAASLSVAPLSAETLAVPEGEPDEEFFTAYRKYAAELFSETCAEDLAKGENAMVSPESVMMALGMTANGAKGDTLTQMETAMGGLGIDKLNGSMLYLADKALNAENVRFNVANSVWVRDDAERITMKQEFCDKVKSFYGADSFLAPFDRTTCDDINNWVSNETNGMISEILDEIPDGAVAYLVNAIAFEGEWDAAYEDYQVQEGDIFTNSKGEEERVNMLYSTESEYLSDENTTGFLKFYKGYDYAFMALLPDEGIDPADYVSALDGDKLTGLWNSRRGCDVYAAIPEFTADYSNELSDELMSMGMELPFTDAADFSDMATTSSGALYISRVLHKTHLEVDRHGTKAAAATAVEMTDECDAEITEFDTVYLNRPFVYAIVDTQNGMPVFIGAVNTVNES